MERVEGQDTDMESLETSDHEAVELSPEQFRALTPPTEEDAVAISEARSEVIKKLEEERDQELEAQFAQEHTLNLEKEHLDYTVLRGVGESTQKEWVVFVGGFSSIKETYKAEMFDLAKTGHNILFVSPDQGVSPNPEEENYFAAKHGHVAETIERKAVAVSRLVDHLGISQANIIGHSQGGAVSAIFAGMRPMLAKRLILDNPVGIIGERSTGELLRGVHAEAKKGFSTHEEWDRVVSQQDTTTWAKQLKKLIQFPLWRVTQEVPGIAHADIRPILAELKRKKTEGGPEIILINANDDKIFRSEEVERALGEDPLTDYLDRWAMYADKDAGHGKFDRNKPGLYPQIMDSSNAHMSIIHQIITEKNTE